MKFNAELMFGVMEYTHTGLQLKLKANVLLQNFMETSGFLEHSHWVTWLTK